MKCQFCSEDQKEWDGKRVGYITGVVSEQENGQNHVHVHGNFDNKIVAEDIIKATAEAAGISNNTPPQDKLAGIKEIIFHNRQRIGDMLMFTCGVRDFAKAYPHIKVNVISTCGHIWDHAPYIDRSIKPFYKNGVILETCKPDDFYKGNTNVVKIGPGKLTNSSNRLDWHFANAFRVSIEENLGISIPQGESRPDIWMTEDEYSAPRVTERPYWIIVTGGEKGWGCKMYPTSRWQEVIDQNPDILFYQLGANNDQHVRLRGKNVVDYIGKTENRDTGIRDLFKLFLNAEGSIGLVSFHMHLSGGMKKPCVVVAGAREPVSFTRYAGHQYIATDGTLPCATSACWHCDIKACTNPVTVNNEIVPKCVDMIKSEDVTRYLRRYYEGGLLSLDKPSAKGKVNLVKTPRLVTVPTPVPSSVNTYGLTFNGGALTENDWAFICQTIDQYKVKSVLEFGSGLSTLLLNDRLKNVVTYECSKGWIDKLAKLKPGMNVRLWDGVTIDTDEHFDMAFVDGPANDKPREHSTKLGSERAKVVIVHDAGREWSKKYQEQYLANGFDGPIKGGHRCHLWVKKNDGQLLQSNIVNSREASKSIKFVSTARGWGGCARSITTMMKMLLADGHKVEFIPFRNSVGSSEFQACLKNDLKDVRVNLSYDSLKEPCDVLVVYADDYVWEFGKPEVAEWFSGIKADKKIMVLNYRRGPVGQAEWTKGWDKYIFLNSNQERELLRFIPEAKTRVLASCTDLTPFLSVTPNFEDMIRIVRHNSQGDSKFSKNFGDELANVHDSREDLTISMMPGPSFIQPGNRFKKVGKTADPKAIASFLASGNLFWYSLPEGYMDMGPRVIIEAMAVGLPILADNWGGAVDRVTPECGWLCNEKSEFVNIVKNITLDELKQKGAASKQRAIDEFRAENWIKEIVE